jgi:hypothetical protein
LPSNLNPDAKATGLARALATRGLMTVLAAAVGKVLEALAPGLGPRQIPIHFPHHSDIPEDDPRPYLT